MRFFTLFCFFTALFFTSVKALSQAPTITSVSPTHASFGQTLTINGTNLGNVTFVTTYGDLATDVQIISPTQITVTLTSSPANMGGAPVYLENGSGSTSFNDFYYCPTTIADFTISNNANSLGGSIYTFCFGDTVELTLPAGYVSYEWIGQNSFTQTLKISQNTSLWDPSVRVTDNNGCIINKTFYAEYNFSTYRPSAPTIVTQQGRTRLQDRNDVLYLIDANNTYQNIRWSTGENAASIIISQAGEYWAVGVGANGCLSDTARITILPPVEITSVSPAVGAVGQTLTINGTSLEGTTAVSIFGIPATNLQVISSTQVTVTIPSYNKLNNAAVLLESSNGNAPVFYNFDLCIDPSTLTLFTEGLTNEGNGVYSFCAGETATLTALIGSLEPGITYNWIGRNNATNQLEITETTTGPFTVEVIHPNGCQYLFDDGITQINSKTEPAPALTIPNGGIFCAGDSIKISSADPNVGVMFNGSYYGTEAYFSVPGTYYAVSGEDGCRPDTTYFTVSFGGTSPVITSLSDSSFTEGQEITLTGSNLTTVTQIAVGATFATLTPVSDTELRFTVPNGADASGLSVFGICKTVITQYTVSQGPATITSVLPAAVFAGDSLFIFGTNLNQVTEVSIFGNNATFDNQTNNIIKVLVPQNITQGTQPLRLATPGGDVLFNDLTLCEPNNITITKSSITTVDLCFGGTLTLYGPPGFASYQWSDGQTTQDAIYTDTANLPASVYLIATNSSGCRYFSNALGPFTAFRTRAIEINTVELRTSINSLFDTLTLYELSGFYTNIRWSTGQTGTSIRITQPGVYWAVGISSEGCISDTGRITISSASLLSPPYLSLFSDTSICSSTINFSITAGGSSNPNEGLYMQIDGANGQFIDFVNNYVTIPITTTGTYSFYTYNKAIGLSSASAAVTRIVSSSKPNKPELDTPPGSFCSTSSVLINVINGAQGSTYLWNDNSTGSNIWLTTPGVYWVVVSLNGCPSDTTFLNYYNTSDPGSPTANLTATTVCGNESTLLNWTSPSNAVKIYFNGQLLTTEFGASGSISVSEGGIYDIKSYDPVTGCIRSSGNAVVDLFQRPKPDAPIINNISGNYCASSQASVFISNFDGNGTYQWSNGSTGIPGSFSASGNYWVIATSMFGCKSDTTFFSIQIVSPPTQPNNTISSTIICEGDSVFLTWNGTAPAVKFYVEGRFPKTIFQSSGTIGIGEAGDILLTGYDPVTGCESDINPIRFSTTTSPVSTIVTASINGDSVLCDGQTTQITITENLGLPNAIYTLSDGRTSSSPNFLISTSGVYWATVTTDNGCVSKPSNSVAVVINAIPNVPIITTDNVSGTFCEGDSIILVSSDLQPVLWSDNSFSNRLAVKISGTYSARAVARNCTSSVSNEFTLTQLPKPLGISINQQGPISLCPNATILLTSTSLQPGLTQGWTRNGELVAFTTGNLVVDFPGNYGVRNFNGNCFSDASGTVEITVSASPNNPARIIASATEICRWSESTSKINLSASNRGTGMYYSWSKDGEPIAAQSLVDTLTVSEPGLYKLYSFDGATCGTVDSLLITEAQTTDYPEIQVISGTGCRGDSLVLGSTIPYTFYRWSDGSTASTIKVTGESFISLAAGNSMNCMANSTPFGFASLPRPDLCQVSVLDTTNINQIVWIKAPVGLGIDSVIILREERGLNNLKQIGKVDFDERPEFLDRSLELNTNTQNYRYRVQFVDSCGRRSVVSDSSRTMFLRVGKALGGGNNLFWTPYEGEPARIYYITRKQKGAGSLLPIDSVPGNIRTYSDRKPDANDSTEYQIWFERSAICSEDKAGVRTSRSNTRPAVPVPPPPRSNSRVFFRPCPGTTVTYGNFTFDSTGSYIVYVRDRNNMDSAVVINVTVARKDTIRQNQRLCNGRNIVFGSQLILTAGTYQRTLPNSLGCDSTIFLTVELDPKDSIGVEADICQGAIYSFEGQNYNTSGTYFRYLQNRLGCDSVRSLVLTVNANPDAPVITLLPGDTLSASGQGIFTWSVNGNVIPTITQGKIPIPPLAANYTVTLTDTNGCSATSLTFAFAGFAKLNQGKSQVWVYPNPSTGSIALTGLPENEIPAIIRNAIGQTVWQGIVANERNLNLSHLTAGTYLLEVNQTQIRLVIVK